MNPREPLLETIRRARASEGPPSRLIEGVKAFQSFEFPARRKLFEDLASGQKPHTLFVTCSDSRIDPSLITQTRAGELFVIRNAGNLVPSPDKETCDCGEAATIEYAVEVLGVSDIVLCGHSHCGAMAALIDPEQSTLDETIPHLTRWLDHAEDTLERLRAADALGAEDAHDRAIEENVCVQLAHLTRYDCVARRLAAGDLDLHGWIYRLDKGDVLALQPDSGRFEPLIAAASA